MTNKKATMFIDRLAEFLQREGITCEQTAWELAIDLESLLVRLIKANKDVVKR